MARPTAPRKARIPNTIKLPDGRRVTCRIFDAGPDGPIDRYTIALRAVRSHGGRGPLYYPYLACNCTPFHPLGFGQHGENPFFLTGKHLGRRVRFDDLPPDVKRFILQDFGIYSAGSAALPLPAATSQSALFPD